VVASKVCVETWGSKNAVLDFENNIFLVFDSEIRTREKYRNQMYRPISIFNCNPLSVQTSFSLILDRLSKSNQRPNDRTNSLLTDGLRIYIRKSFEGSEKWLRTERGLRLKIEIDLYQTMRKTIPHLLIPISWTPLEKSYE